MSLRVLPPLSSCSTFGFTVERAKEVGRKGPMAPSKKKRAVVTRAKTSSMATIGIIGGSGLYSMNGLTDTREITVKTPFGNPSDALVLGVLEGKRVAFLARHGRGHRILPSEINFRANIYAMK